MGGSTSCHHPLRVVVLGRTDSVPETILPFQENDCEQPNLASMLRPLIQVIPLVFFYIMCFFAYLSSIQAAAPQLLRITFDRNACIATFSHLWKHDETWEVMEWVTGSRLTTRPDFGISHATFRVFSTRLGASDM